MGRRIAQWICAAATLAICLAVEPAEAPELGYRQVDADNFVFRLRNASALSEPAAQAYISRAAKSVCKEREPLLGVYRFGSNEFLGKDAPENKPAGFEFIQEVKCVVAQSVAAIPTPAPLTKEEKDKAAASVLDRSELYFRLINDAKIDEAFRELSQESGLWEEGAWKRSKRDFQAMAGALQRIGITKVTVYENPKSAPQPGLYVAADFRNIWQNVPIQCGYLMWYRTASGDFQITREETGHVTAEQWNAMPEAQRQGIPQALRCR